MSHLKACSSTLSLASFIGMTANCNHLKNCSGQFDNSSGQLSELVVAIEPIARGNFLLNYMHVRALNRHAFKFA